jgi:hypothetical protein
MTFTNPFFIGIEPSGSKKPFTCAIFSQVGKLVTLSNVDMDELIAIASSKPEAVVAINSPYTPNTGLVRQAEIRETLKPLHFSGRNQDMRLAEYKLKERGINVLMTPSKKELCSNWVQSGFEVYKKLMDLGFDKFPHATSTLQILETHSHSSFIVLAASQLLPKLSIEGRIQRQLILYEEGLSINDPMEFFEEVTRHKLLRGIMPTELIYTPEELDAMAAGLVALRAGEGSSKLISVGDADEGQIVLPVETLLEKY